MATKKATKKTTKKDDYSTAQKVSIGVGLTTAAVAAAGAYFLYGSDDAIKNRKKVKSWMLRAKADVLEKLEKAEKMTEEEYVKLVDKVSEKYAKTKDATKTDVASFKREMKEYWSGIQSLGKPVKQIATSAAKGAAVGAAKGAASSAKKTTKKKLAGK